MPLWFVSIINDKRMEMKVLFGKFGIAKTYGWCDFLKDSIVPFIFSVVSCWVIVLCCDDLKPMVDKVAGLAVAILPSYIGLLVAAYTILLSMMTTETAKKLSELKTEKIDGKTLLRKMNSDFVVCIYLAGTCLLLGFVVSMFCLTSIESDYADVINTSCIGLMVFLLSFSLTVLYGLVENLFNLGQTTTVL